MNGIQFGELFKKAILALPFLVVAFVAYNIALILTRFEPFAWLFAIGVTAALATEFVKKRSR